jgi:serine/threonine protein kinase
MSSKPSKKYAQNELVAGRYLTSHVIGKGGMGKVVYGKHVDLQQEVAIKYLRTSSRSGGESASKRFCQEALTYASINHPNIVKLLDFERTQHGELRMVLEYVKGETLGTFLRRTGQCHPLFAIDLTIQIAQGLSAAHAKSIIHRDLKPDNIMLSPLTKSRRHYHVKLLDFGIAKNLHHEGERYTAAGTVCGTPDYMSPEQARGLDIDTRSDIYSLGVLLFEMLAGRLPYVATGKQKVMSAHCWTPIPLVSDFSNYPVPTVLEDLLQRCLAKNANDRFQSVEELINALEHVAEREYDQVSPTKFNALTPTGERIRFNQHPARDLDLLQQGSSIDLPATPSMSELDKLREEAYSIKSSVVDEPVQRSQQSSVLGSAVPLSVLVNDESSIKAQIEENVIEAKAKVSHKGRLDEPQASAKDYQVSGLSRMSLKSWFKSMWTEFAEQVEGGNPRPLMGAIGVTVLIVFSISISLQPNQSVPVHPVDSGYTTSEVAQADVKENSDFSANLADKAISSSASLSYDNGKKVNEATQVNRLIRQEQDKKRKQLFNSAEDDYQRGRLKDATNKIAPYLGTPRVDALMSKVKLLQGFLKHSENTSCARFLKEKSETIHIEISKHPLVKAHITHCNRVIPPDTL